MAAVDRATRLTGQGGNRLHPGGTGIEVGGGRGRLPKETQLPRWRLYLARAALYLLGSG